MYHCRLFTLTVFPCGLTVFPPWFVAEFPRFGSSVHVSNDYQLTKLCCTVMAFHLRLVKQYHRKLQLLQKSVRGYVWVDTCRNCRKENECHLCWYMCTLKYKSHTIGIQTTFTKILKMQIRNKIWCIYCSWCYWMT